MTKGNINKAVNIPQRLLIPIKRFLEEELDKMKTRKQQIKDSDPFLDGNRTTENSLEEDVDEQVGHFDAEVKANFVTKQIVQLRKALTRIKLGKYGICDSCGKMIDTDRLSVRPEATNCIECNKESES